MKLIRTILKAISQLSAIDWLYATLLPLVYTFFSNKYQEWLKGNLSLLYSNKYTLALVLFFASVLILLIFKFKKEQAKIMCETLETIKTAVCKFQGEILNHSMCLGEEHKDLRISIENYEKTPEIERTPEGLKNIRRCYDRIVEMGDTNLKSSFTKFSETIKIIFSNMKSSKTVPRVGLKIYTYNNETGEEFVNNINLHGTNNQREPYKLKNDNGIESYSMFSKTLEKGLPSLCNHVPKSAASDLFYSPRLDNKKCFEYQNNKFKFNRNNIITKWRDCWHDANTENSDLSYYKSTLIVPITLVNNSLNANTRTSLCLNNLNNHESITIGALCFDHVDENYFASNKPKSIGIIHEFESVDKDIGYIFADLLSLFMFTSRNCIQGSETFDKATYILNKK